METNESSSILNGEDLESQQRRVDTLIEYYQTKKEALAKVDKELEDLDDTQSEALEAAIPGKAKEREEAEFHANLKEQRKTLDLLQQA